MAKRKSKRKAVTDNASPGEIDTLTAQLGGLVLQGRVARKRWDAYFGPGDLEDFQRLCADLRIEGDLSSKTKCRNALAKVHVNIPQFLNAIGNGYPVKFFKNPDRLAVYTSQTRQYFPKKDIPKGSPLTKLLRIMT